MIEQIKRAIGENISVHQMLLEDTVLIKTLDLVIERCVQTYREGGRLFFCGNGGSAADAQHIAAELSGRFKKDRTPLSAEALHTNTSYLTAVANDFGYEYVFARIIEAQARKGDILFLLSTSGNSPNIIKALEVAHAKNITSVGMTGASGGELNDKCTYMLRMPSFDTARIQECHILIGHILCEMIEQSLFD